MLEVDDYLQGELASEVRLFGYQLPDVFSAAAGGGCRQLCHVGSNLFILTLA